MVQRDVSPNDAKIPTGSSSQTTRHMNVVSFILGTFWQSATLNSEYSAPWVASRLEKIQNYLVPVEQRDLLSELPPVTLEAGCSLVLHIHPGEPSPAL